MEHQTVSLPRVMVAAPASSSGKTSLTCALLQAALNLGVVLQSGVEGGFFQMRPGLY